jgi:hypothetical protein
LAATETEKQTVAGTSPETKQDIKEKIVDFMWKLQKEGYRPATIKSYGKILIRLTKLGADLSNPENIKEIIAKQQQWDENTKFLVATAYNSFVENMLEIKWKTPKYRKQEKIP